MERVGTHVLFRIAILVLAVPWLASEALAQDRDFAWVDRAGGGSDERGFAVAVDGSGNVYVTGSFESTVDFDPGPDNHPLTANSPSPYIPDVFVWKLDAGGGLAWAKRFGGYQADSGFAIALDREGNVYTTGSFHGFADFDPDPDVTYELGSVYGNNEVFLSKLDTKGRFIWAKSLGGIIDDIGTSIAVDEDGSVYTTGVFRGSADFDPDPSSTYILTAGAEDDAFISKLDREGRFVWARKIGGTYYDIGLGITVDPGGNVYSTGYFSGTVDFDPGPGTFLLTAAINLAEVYVLKLDGDGNFVWARSLGGSRDDVGSGIAVDGNGNVYVTGSFQETADFDPDPSKAYPLTSVGYISGFVCKLDRNGAFVWARSLTGNGSDYGASVALDLAGNVYVTGSFQVGADFDPGPGTYILNGGFRDAFVWKLDAEGRFVWAKSMGGSSEDEGRSVGVDRGGNVYVTGSFSSATADFVSGPGSYNLTSTGGADVFVLKLSQTPVLRFTSQTTATWTPLSGELAYNTYRSASSLPGTFECLTSHASVPGVTDPERPARGSFDSYLVTTVDVAGQEGTLGRQAEHGTPTTERPNPNPCP